MLNSDRLNLPQDITILPIQFQNAVGIVRRGNSAGTIGRDPGLVETTVAGGHDDIAAGCKGRRTPDVATWNYSGSGKIEPRDDCPGCQVNRKHFAYTQIIGLFGSNTNVCPTVSNCGR